MMGFLSSSNNNKSSSKARRWIGKPTIIRAPPPSSTSNSKNAASASASATSTTSKTTSFAFASLLPNKKTSAKINKKKSNGSNKNGKYLIIDESDRTDVNESDRTDYDVLSAAVANQATEMTSDHLRAAPSAITATDTRTNDSNLVATRYRRNSSASSSSSKVVVVPESHQTSKQPHRDEKEHLHKGSRTSSSSLPRRRSSRSHSSSPSRSKSKSQRSSSRSNSRTATAPTRSCSRHHAEQTTTSTSSATSTAIKTTPATTSTALIINHNHPPSYYSKIDSQGRCPHHTFIQLQLRSRRNVNVWKILLESCPVCDASLEDDDETVDENDKHNQEGGAGTSSRLHRSRSHSRPRRLHPSSGTGTIVEHQESATSQPTAAGSRRRRSRSHSQSRPTSRPSCSTDGSSTVRRCRSSSSSSRSKRVVVCTNLNDVALSINKVSSISSSSQQQGNKSTCTTNAVADHNDLKSHSSTRQQLHQMKQRSRSHSRSRRPPCITDAAKADDASALKQPKQQRSRSHSQSRSNRSKRRSRSSSNNTTSSRYRHHYNQVISNIAVSTATIPSITNEDPAGLYCTSKMIHKLHHDGFFQHVVDNTTKKFDGSLSSTTLVASNNAHKDGCRREHATEIVSSFVKAATSIAKYHSKEQNEEHQVVVQECHEDQVEDKDKNDDVVLLTTSTMTKKCTTKKKKQQKSVHFIDHHQNNEEAMAAALLKKHSTPQEEQYIIDKPSSPIVTEVYTRPYTLQSEKCIFYYSRKEVQNFRQCMRVNMLKERASTLSSNNDAGCDALNNNAYDAYDTEDMKGTPLLQKILFDK